MAEKKPNYAFAMIAIVAIVAIVGMVVMFMNMKAQTAGASLGASDENLLGLAVGCRGEDTQNDCNYCCRYYASKIRVSSQNCVDACGAIDWEARAQAQ